MGTSLVQTRPHPALWSSLMSELTGQRSLCFPRSQLQQICKILNAHMDSLQWVDQNSVLLQRRVEDVSKLCDNTR